MSAYVRISWRTVERTERRVRAVAPPVFFLGNDSKHTSRKLIARLPQAQLPSVPLFLYSHRQPLLFHLFFGTNPLPHAAHPLPLFPLPRCHPPPLQPRRPSHVLVSPLPVAAARCVADPDGDQLRLALLPVGLLPSRAARRQLLRPPATAASSESAERVFRV